MKFTIMKLVLLFIYCIFPSSSYYTEDEIDGHWNQYKNEYGKSYNSTDDLQRRQHFAENLRMVTKHKLEAHNGLHSYELDINHLSDMSPEEIESYTQCLIPLVDEDAVPISNLTNLASFSLSSLPKSVDWRVEGMVTHVKDQGSCGACWAFAAIGALEGYVKRKTGELVSLSEQNLIDCATDDDGARGCSGGTLKAGFEYTKRNKGVETEESYPYTGEAGRCDFSNEEIGGELENYGYKTDSEEHLLLLVAHFGPVATSIYANTKKFTHYRKGIFHDDECKGHAVNHGVLVVGYGEEDGKKYWIIKNSWGPKWGLDGYIYMERGSFMCSVGKAIAYPIDE